MADVEENIIPEKLPPKELPVKDESDGLEYSRMNKFYAFLFRVRRQIRLIFRRFRSEKVMAVHDDDLDGLLKRMGLAETIAQGKEKCKSCKCVISRENLGVISNENGAIILYCLSTNCAKNTETNA